MIEADLITKLSRRNGAEELVGSFPDSRKSLARARDSFDKPSTKLLNSLTDFAQALGIILDYKVEVLKTAQILKEEPTKIQELKETSANSRVIKTIGVIFGQIYETSAGRPFDDLRQEILEEQISKLRLENRSLRQGLLSHLDPIYARAYRIARYLHELGEIAAFKDPKLKEIQEFCERLHDSILLDRDKPEQAAELIYSEDLTTMIDLARAVIKDLSESSSGFVLRAHFLKKIAKENLQKLGREPLLNEEKFSDLDYLLLALESYENAGKSDLCSEPDPYRYNQLLDELSAFDQQLTRESIKRLLDAGYLSKDFTDFLDVWLSERSGAVIVAEAPTPKKDLAPEVLQDARSNFVGMDRLLDLGINENTARRLSKTCTQEEYDRRRLSLADCWKGRDFADRSIRDNPNILTVSPTEFNTFIALLRKALALTSDLSETDALSPVSYPVRYSGKESVQKVLASLTVRQEFNALIAEIDKADLKLDGRTAMAILRYGFVYRGKYMIGGQRMDAELVHLRQNLERHVNGIDAQRDLIAKTVKKLISFGAIDDSKGFSLGTAAVIPVLRKAVNWIVKVNDPAAGEFEFGAL